jgi:hypothetical protein
MQISKLVPEQSNNKSVLNLGEFPIENIPPSSILPLTSPNANGGAEKGSDFVWESCFESHSRMLVAALEPGTLLIRHANDFFWQFIGLDKNELESGVYAPNLKAPICLLDIFPDLQDTASGYLYRRHILYLVMRDIYQIKIPNTRLLDESAIGYFRSPLYLEPRAIKFWLRSNSLKVTRIDPTIDELAELGWERLSAEEREAKLMDGVEMEAWGKRLRLDNYQISGLILLEGLDFTERETIHNITGLLIDRDSILRPEKYRRINQRLRSLFRATSTIILSAESDQARLFLGTERKELRTSVYSMQSLVGSHFLRAAEANRVWNVPDLRVDCQTDCERALVNLGARSLLLIPLVVKAMKSSSGAKQLAGVVGLVSDRLHNFDSIDCRHAEELIPALAAALRQASQQRFTNIHPAVEWRFIQEAERRSWGLPPETISFNNIYPLYGISDIRGSSEERNRSIQGDLLEQFRLALAVVNAFCESQETSLGEQLRLDLLERIEQLKGKVTVDAEVTALKYLGDRVEIYFDYFAQSSPEAQAAVEAYRQACANEHRSVYVSRAHYDQTISQINACLKETWERWQVRMQKIIPHYCDIESTDGINHMIYVGESIDSKFCKFHLRSLRYEQMKAVCDCARTAFSLQSRYETKLEVTHLVLVQDLTVDIFHDENTEKLFDVRGTRDIRYEIVKKRIDKAVDEKNRKRITQPGMLTLVYSTEEEWSEYQEYLRYLARENWVGTEIESGTIEPLQGITGLKFALVRILPEAESNSSVLPEVVKE